MGPVLHRAGDLSIRRGAVSLGEGRGIEWPGSAEVKDVGRVTPSRPGRDDYVGRGLGCVTRASDPASSGVASCNDEGQADRAPLMPHLFFTTGLWSDRRCPRVGSWEGPRTARFQRSRPIFVNSARGFRGCRVGE